MVNSVFQPSIKGQSVRYQLAIVFSLVLIIPNLFLIYILYEHQLISYEAFQNFKFPILVFLLFSLFGLTLLRQAFDEIMLVANQAREAVTGKIDKLAIGRESRELAEIANSFNVLLAQFRESSQELNKRVRELVTLNELTEFSCRMISIDELLDAVLRRAMDVLQARVGSIMLVDPDGQYLRIGASKGHSEPLLKGTKIKIEDSAVSKAIKEKKSIFVTDIEKDSRFLQRKRSEYRTASFISVPLRVKDRVIGVLNLADKEDEAPFDREDLAFLVTLLGEIGFAIENAHLYEDLKQKIAELERTNESLAAIGEMSASIAHELNNYLSGIFMRVQLLPEFIKTLEFLKPEDKYNDIEFLLSLDKPLPSIAADTHQMEQVFVNLFNNAVDAMEKKGKIKVETRAGEEFIDISVTDEGPGVPEDIREKIFEPRFSTKESGFGFGLATCYRIITNHGGTIQVEGDVGKGARFRIQLPLVEPNPPLA